MASEMLRKLAAELRREADDADRTRMRKCAEFLLTAEALALLRRKVTPDA